MYYLILAVLPLAWHYLLCSALLFFCWNAAVKKRFPLCVTATILMFVLAAVGFWLVYAGPFVESGKTFTMYVTRYAVYTLPIFAFPLAGLLLSLRSRRK